MEHVHAEYIKETPSFVRVDMKLTKSRACDAAKYVYGPYTLQKRTQKATRVATAKQPSAPKKVTEVDEPATSGKVVDPVDTQEVSIEFSMMRGQNTKKNKKKTLEYVTSTRLNVIKGNKLENANRFNEMVDSIIEKVGVIDIEGKKDLVDKLRARKISDDEMRSMTKFGSVTDDEDGSDIDSDEEEEDESGDGEYKQEDEKDGTATLTAKALSDHVENVTNVKGAPSEPNDATAEKGQISIKKKGTSDDAATTTIVDAGKSKKTPTETKAKSAKKKGADTEAEGGAEKTKVMVHIDCWFYTGRLNGSSEGDIKTNIKKAAVNEGVLDTGQAAEVHATTTTITRSALCISSSLLSTVSETPLAVSEDQAAGAQVPGGVHSFGANQMQVYVDFKNFKDYDCLFVYIKKEAEKAADEAVEAVETVEVDGVGKTEGVAKTHKGTAEEATEDASKPDAAVAGLEKVDTQSELAHSSVLSPKEVDGDGGPVYIFYTVEPPVGPEGTQGASAHGKKNKAQNYNDIKKASGNKNYWLRSYVPSFLAKRVVLDAMMDLAARCLEKIPDYESTTRAIQTIMLSGVSYYHDNGAKTELSSMQMPKPAASADADQPTGAINEPGSGISGVHDDDRADDHSVGFGALSDSDVASHSGYNAANGLKHDLMGLLTAALKNTDSNPEELIVSSLYTINVSTKFSADILYLFTKPNNEAKENIGIKGASDRSISNDGLIMYTMLISDHILVVTQKHGGKQENKYKLYLFSLDSSGGAIDDTQKSIARDFLTSNLEINAKLAGQLLKSIPSSASYVGDKNGDAGTKIRAIRITEARSFHAKTKQILAGALSALTAADKIVYDIQKLDGLFLQYMLNPEYTWSNGKLSDELNDELSVLSVTVDEYNWHGDRSFQRIVAQHAAFKVEDKLNLFSTGTKKKYTTNQLLERYNKLNTETKVELHKKKASLYYTCLFVTALRDQNFGALFTSQPNFSTKPVDDDKPEKPNYDKKYNSQRPNCGEDGGNSPIEDVDSEEKTVDLSKIDKAVSFVDGLIDAGVLIKRPKPNTLLDCKGTLEQLDGMLNAIQKDDIGQYTSGGAGKSTEYEAMLGQSMKCFVMFLPLIEKMLSDKYPKENVDVIRSRALSYGCVSHGLDPKHIIAVRYAMNKDQATYESHSYPLSRKICKELFELLEEESTGPGSFPVTRELMRTRVLGAITVIEEISREPASLDFGLSYLKPKRASMFI